MELLRQLADIFLHLNKYLPMVIEQYGTLTYVILFAIVFCETGLVVTPFLPGDSLLFAVGTMASPAMQGKIDLWLATGLLIVAAIAGDTLNYWIGHYIGPRVFHFEGSRFFNREHLDRTHAFYEKYGGKTIIIARFVPIVRTFAPFVAGVGSMSYGKFIAYNVIGGVAWVVICVFAGYYFGGIAFVQKHFELVILAIIFLSILPGIVEYVRHRREAAGRSR